MPRKKPALNLSVHQFSAARALALARKYSYSISELFERLVDQADAQERRLRRRDPNDHLQLKLFDPKKPPRGK